MKETLWPSIGSTRRDLVIENIKTIQVTRIEQVTKNIRNKVNCDFKKIRLIFKIFSWKWFILVQQWKWDKSRKNREEN